MAKKSTKVKKPKTQPQPTGYDDANMAIQVMGAKAMRDTLLRNS